MAEQVLEEVDAWITNHGRIQFAPPVQGGWERWAQIDFSLYLNSIGVQTILEDQCYTSGQRDDLTVGPQVGPPAIPGAIMELKVLNITESLAQYRTKLTNDQQKLAQAMHANRAGYMKCSYGIASSTRLIPLLQAQYPHQVITVANFEGFLQQYIPGHHIERATSLSGEVWAISFVYVD